MLFNNGSEWAVNDVYYSFGERAADPQTPEANQLRLYAKDNGSGVSQLCYKNDAGTVVCLPTVGPLVTGSGVSGRVAFWNGTSTLTSDSNLTFSTDTLTVTKLVASTSIIDSGLTLGSVMFAGTAGLLSQDNANFFWDDTNNRLGIGTASPGVPLDVLSTAVDSIKARSAGANAQSVVAANTQGNTRLAVAGTTNDFTTGSAAGDSILRWADTKNMLFGISTAVRFQIGSSGQWGIGGATYGTALDIFTSGGASAAPTWTSPGALTKVDDTNVTLTLGGTPTSALLRATSLTLGWTGTLGVARGGTNIASYAVGDLLYASGATILSKLADVAAGSYLRSGGVTTAPLWSTLVLPNAATANRIVYASATNTYGESANLAYDGTDFLLGSGTRARMSGQNRFRYLNIIAYVSKTAAQTISNNTDTAVAWDTETGGFDTDTIHDNSTNNSRLTVAIAGKYLVFGAIGFDANATGARYAALRANGTTYFSQNRVPVNSGTETTVINVLGIVSLAANEYVEMTCFQNSGGNLNTLNNNASEKFFGIAYLGE